MLRRLAFVLLLTALGAAGLRAQEDTAPAELDKVFDRYCKAWTHADWGRIFDLTSPALQNIMLRDFKTREGWIKWQASDFKDTITEMERKAVFRMSNTVYTFVIVTKGKRPRESGGKDFEAGGFASFELLNGKWFLVDPVIPKEMQPEPPAPPRRK